MTERLWDRMPGESGRAYRAFCAYRDLGGSRSVTAAYRAVTGREEARQAPHSWKGWGERFDWHRRAAAYDLHLAQVGQRAREQALAEREREWARRHEEARERGWQAGLALLGKAEQMLRLPLLTVTEETVIEERAGPGGQKYPVTINRTVIAPARWSFADAARMLGTGLELMRLAAGLATGHVSADVVTAAEAAAQELEEEQRDARLLELLERALSRRDAALLEARRGGLHIVGG